MKTLVWGAAVLLMAASCGKVQEAPPDAEVPDAPPPPPPVDSAVPDAPEPAALTLSPTSGAFEGVVGGGASAPQMFKVSNEGGQATGPLTIRLSGANADDFDINAGGCPGSLAAGGSCDVAVTFTAGAVGDRVASLDVSADPGGAVSAELTGRGVSAARITLAPAEGSSTDFGQVVIGSSSDFTYVVRNTGGQTSGPVAVSLQPDGTFTLLADLPTDCVSGTTTLAGGATCDVRVHFAPVTAGDKNTMLTVSANPGGSAMLSLHGVGLTPGTLEGSDGSHDFGGVEVGVASAQFTWTLRNTGGVATGVPVLANDNAGEVSVTNNCTAAIPAGSSCTILVRFTPSAGGARSGSLRVTASPGGTAMLAVTAAGQWRLTVTRSGSGTVTSTTPGIDCGTDCNQLYDNGTRVTIGARTTNGSNSHFQEWTGACAGSVRDCTVTMTGQLTANAVFGSNSRNLVFISSAAFAANLGGVTAYDTKCNELATAAGINNSTNNAFVAWLSQANSSAASRITSTGGYVRLDGKPFALTLADLKAKEILYPPRITETGSDIINAFTYSNTLDNGAARSGDCTAWTSTSGGTEVGNAGAGPGLWTINSASTCGSSRRIVCMQKTSSLSVTQPAVPPGAKIAYYTTAAFTGTGGLTAANSLCNANKPTGFTNRTYKALLSTTTAAASTLLTPTASYYRPDGVLIGTGNDIIGGDLQAGIWQRNDLSYAGGLVRVFTGSISINGVGTVDSTCNNYTTSTGTARMGAVNNAAGNTFWFHSTDACNTASRFLYCVEQ